MIIFSPLFFYCQCDFQPGNPAGGTETVCFYDSDDVLLGCSYNCQITGQQIKCGYNEGSEPYPNYYKVTFSTLECFNASVLPVNLIDFSITKEFETFIINWSTLSEKQNNYFILEKSNDGFIFDQISIIYSTGDSFEQVNYSYTDYDIQRGVSYYRLIQVDNNDIRTVYKTLSINYLPKNEIEVISNKNNPYILHLFSESEIESVRIISNNGSVQPIKLIGNTINTERFQSLLIFIEVTFKDNKKTYVKQMI